MSVHCLYDLRVLDNTLHYCIASWTDFVCIIGSCEAGDIITETGSTRFKVCVYDCLTLQAIKALPESKILTGVLAGMLYL